MLQFPTFFGYLFQKTNKNYTITYSLDGYDEISLTGPTKLIRNSGEFIFEPHHFGYNSVTKDSISGGNSVKESAFIFKSILEALKEPDQTTKSEVKFKEAEPVTDISELLPLKKYRPLELNTIASEKIATAKIIYTPSLLNSLIFFIF